MYVCTFAIKITVHGYQRLLSLTVNIRKNTFALTQ